MNAIEYSVSSEHLTSKVVHELLFSIRKKRFVKPALSDKHEGRLIYRLLPGTYVKFRLFALKKSDYARFSISYVHIDEESEYEKEVYAVELSFSDFLQIALELGVPYVLKEFVRMTPEYHSVAKVDEPNMPEDKDVSQIINEIKEYLEKKVTGQ
jgi:hypothetical protein